MKIIAGMRWEGRNIIGGIFVEQAQPYSNDDRTSDKPQMREQFGKTSQQYSSKLSSGWKITEIMCHRLQETMETDTVSASEVLDQVLGQEKDILMTGKLVKSEPQLCVDHKCISVQFLILVIDFDHYTVVT